MQICRIIKTSFFFYLFFLGPVSLGSFSSRGIKWVTVKSLLLYMFCILSLKYEIFPISPKYLFLELKYLNNLEYKVSIYVELVCTH